MKRYNGQEQRLLAIWAADCAERVLPLFEKMRPKDRRPREAIKACRRWVRTGVFRMADIRKASLGAHAAARKMKNNDMACFAARAAGHSVATAHVPEHAFGSSYYAIKALEAVDSANEAGRRARISRELKWQWKHLPKALRKGWIRWQARKLPKAMKERWREEMKTKG